ncbi:MULTISPECIES: hypothetical protein [unclassified Mannheimia]|uniref:hypothetical protein n=1 Tax=unclassified Mannheimia TaxID=2645054 RepID=UPI00359DB3E3
MDNDANKNTEGKIRPTDNTGKTVQGIDQVLKYDYNEKGERTSLERDNNVDGKFDYRETYTLDANGRWVGKNIDLTNDGTLDRKEVYSREADGGLTQTNFYNLVNDREVLTKIEYYELNVNNQRTKLSIDTLGDNTINSITRYDLDNLGRTAKAYFDTDGDGSPDRTETYTRDTNNHIIKVESDSNNDNIIDVVTHREVNALGQIMVAKFDNDNNGTIDAIHRYERDQNGNVVRELRDLDNNGVNDVILTNTFNELNQQIANSTKYVDGRISHVTRHFDEYGRVEYEDRRWDAADGTLGVPYRYRYEYDTQNRVSKSTYDKRIDGTLDWTMYNSYENPVFNNTATKREVVYPNGHKATHIMDIDSSGRAEFTYSDSMTDGIIERFNIGDQNGSSSIARTVDLTNWTQEQLAKLGNQLTSIYMGSLSPDTLTLSTEVVAKISSGKTLNIYTSGTDDTLNLKGFTEGKKAAKTIGSETYDLYTANVDGSVYNIYVDDDTNVVLG